MKRNDGTVATDWFRPIHEGLDEFNKQWRDRWKFRLGSDAEMDHLQYALFTWHLQMTVVYGGIELVGATKEIIERTWTTLTSLKEVVSHIQHHARLMATGRR